MAAIFEESLQIAGSQGPRCGAGDQIPQSLPIVVEACTGVCADNQYEVQRCRQFMLLQSKGLAQPPFCAIALYRRADSTTYGQTDSAVRQSIWQCIDNEQMIRRRAARGENASERFSAGKAFGATKPKSLLPHGGVTVRGARRTNIRPMTHPCTTCDFL
jgi:hypothetical protein